MRVRATIAVSLILFVLSATALSKETPVQPTNQTTAMQEFSFIVRVPVSYTKEQAAQANTVWVELLNKWKKDEIWIASFPFPGEGQLISGNEKVVTPGVVVSNEQKVVSAIFLRAKSIEQALELGKTFPVLSYGGSVEVRPIMPRPPATN